MERTTTEGRNRWRWSGVELDRDHTHKISNHNGLRWNDGLEWNNRDQRTGWIKMADGRRRRRRRRRRMDRDGSGWIEVDRGGSGWIEVDRDGSGWIGMDGSGGSECMKGSGRNNDGNPKDRKTMLINEIARNGMEKRDSTL
ncbi:Nipped-B-like protein B [Caenorhabditis elegans]|uniref:Nipped-B-like protein B n=1 Tax=Caenorhabditis elegans TaxID=6239 RepID=G5EF10_CAEEL|nr:Nipped-B-like protein B [Caenorhabditis elegans]CAB76736.4 Nipped-B-like protein B [Caenorhabditis elegans]